jgi:hypothetical protein
MLKETLGLSERLACKAVGLPRSTYRRLPIAATPADPRPDLTKLGDPVPAAKAAMRSIANRAQQLELESRSLRKQLDELTETVAPATSAVFGLGPDTVSALLVTIGDNPDRLRSEAAFARLCGVAPIPLSIGPQHRVIPTI